MSRPCNCGSGLYRRDLVDARGIFCTFICDRCEREKRQQYRTEVFRDADYEADEDIDGERWFGDDDEL